jgi:hypothetical protein
MTYNQFIRHKIARPAFAQALIEMHGMDWHVMPPDTQAELTRMVGHDANLHLRAWEFCQATGVNPLSLTEKTYAENHTILTIDEVASAINLRPV